MKVLEHFDMLNCKPRSTPAEQKIGSDSFDARTYREAVGSLILYAMSRTRPDICWMISKLSQYLSCPTEEHWTAVKQAFRYLRGTLEHVLCHSKCNEGLSSIAYSDADRPLFQFM